MKEIEAIELTTAEVIELMQITRNATAECEADKSMSLTVQTMVKAYDLAIAALTEKTKRERNGGWISVADRLPEEGQSAIAYFVNGFCHLVKFKNDKWEHHHRIICNSTITHWQPLPQPPKEARG